MSGEVRAHSSTNLDLFREKVTTARRQTGRLQRELANALGINPQVLSRKLHGIRLAFPTHAEVKQIIKTLAAWDAITTRVEAIELLSLRGLRAESFSDEEWNSIPLNRLEATLHTSTLNTSYSSSPPIVGHSGLLPTQSTSLLGREGHVQMLLDRLRQPSVRLLTLLGTGGVGKTRLALAVAHMAQSDFADGVFFVSLATIRDVALAPSTIVQTLHLSEPATYDPFGRPIISSQEDVIKGFLREKELLLVLDNVEQIPAITSLISDLLSAAPLLKIMVTSRIVLHLYGEHEFDVPPLDVCIPDQIADLDALSQFPAIRLFVERAQAINPAFRITEQNAATIAHICARLDGLPLAIELAAARTRVHSLSAIMQRLAGGNGQGLTFLRSRAHNVHSRHQTLHETLDWSYELLEPAYQYLFRRLSVFLGGWTAQAALAICTATDQTATLDDVFGQMEALIDRSLVKRMPLEGGPFEEEPECRFYLLETIREYGLGQLEACGEREDLQRRHATYYMTLAGTSEPDLFGPRQFTVVSRLAFEQDNLRAALEWAFANGEAEIVQRMCGVLGKFWEIRTQFREAHHWIDAALVMKQETPPAVRGKLLMAASRLALWEIAYERSRELAQEALALYEAAEDVVDKTSAIFQIGDAWYMQGEHTLARRYLEESLPLFRAQKKWCGYSFTLSRLGAMATLEGNFPQAWTLLNDALPIQREYGEPNLLNVTLVYLGILGLLQGDMAQSLTFLREGLLLARHTGNRYMLAIDLISFGCLLGILREPSYAARICSAAEALFECLNTALPAAYHALYGFYLGNFKSQVDETTWQIWWEKGKALSLEEVCTLALQASKMAAGQEGGVEHDS
jgi:predicted ATPase